MPASESFDVVVVGAGTAGCVVASRLSESRFASVLLLGVGADLRGDIPKDLRDGWRLTRDHSWRFDSEPDAAGTVHPLRAASPVGGTSWLTRYGVRGAPGDFEEWVDLGNPGWGFEDVLPYFNKLETDLDFGHEPWHGDRGPMPIQRYVDFELSDIGMAARTAVESAGFPVVEDHNRPGAVGVGRTPMSSTEGKRVSVADAYLPAISSRPNLTVRGDAHVSRVVFAGNRARGVEMTDGTVIEAERVVLSAGVFGSPMVLMRSGVGPVADLSSLGIPIVVDLPAVGQNLGDHPGVDIDCRFNGESRQDRILHSIATFHSSSAPSGEPPDLMLWMQDPAGPDGEQQAFSIDVILLKPRSRGSVSIRSTNPAALPRVNLPGLGNGDLERLAEGYRMGLEVASHREVRRFCDRLDPTPGPDRLRDHVKGASYPVPHFVGTCTMGPVESSDSVVDVFGSVHGVENLSVVDASIMPSVPSGFTHLPTIMIAERLSERLGSSI